MGAILWHIVTSLNFNIWASVGCIMIRFHLNVVLGENGGFWCHGSVLCPCTYWISKIYHSGCGQWITIYIDYFLSLGTCTWRFSMPKYWWWIYHKNLPDTPFYISLMCCLDATTIALNFRGLIGCPDFCGWFIFSKLIYCRFIVNQDNGFEG